jgi:hypothetical protein
MSELLEAIAEQESRFVATVAEMAEADARELVAMSEPRRLRIVVAAGQMLTRKADSLTGQMEGLADDLDRWFGDGINGNELRILSGSAVLLMQACVKLTELADTYWQRAKAAGAATGDLRPGLDSLAAAKRRQVAITPRFEQWVKRAKRKAPEIDLVAIEQSKEEIGRGEFLTPEQAIKYVRQPRG